MKITAAPKTTTTTNTSDQQSSNLSFIASSNFIAIAMSMSWQLAIVFLAPVLGGYFLDSKFKTSPIFLLIGFVMALSLSFLMIRKFYIQFNEINSKVKGKK
ncbi:MAG: AtpZ/AtpI family protein [bacterium]|jgi:F0F1-type ATP synthase assembly protein I